MDNLEKEKRHSKVTRIISSIVLYSFILPIGFLVFRIVNPEVGVTELTRTRSDYILMLFQCLLGIVVLFYPNVIMKRRKIEIPSNLYLLYVIFLFCAIFLGEVRNFYHIVPYWDTVLHAFSGGMIAALGFSFISLLNDEENIHHLNLTPFFVAFFAFNFAITMGVVWEVYEFVADGVLGTNMQKFALVDGSVLAGREALMDTMEDLIVDGVGAFIISFIGYISLKYNKGWIEKLLLKRKKHHKETLENDN